MTRENGPDASNTSISFVADGAKAKDSSPSINSSLTGRKMKQAVELIAEAEGIVRL